VQATSSASCRTFAVQHVQDTDLGYIASHPPHTLDHLSSLHSVGVDCPWIIRAETSQRLNVSLIDFGLLKSMEGDAAGGGESIAHGACHIYAIIEVCDVIAYDMTFSACHVILIRTVALCDYLINLAICQARLSL